MAEIVHKATLTEFTTQVSLAVEATNTYVKAYYAEKLSDLKDELDKMNRFQEDIMQKLDDEMEELGLTGTDNGSDIAYWAMMYPDSEDTDDFYKRTNSVEYALVDDTSGMDDIDNMMKTW
jgi:hypothetical protein